ncbi:hypothetical protein, partial [Mycobacterium timonense]|uniref:hypothetical protein n=1 Tax=Mycobacterium timonense TaxID=701043 RepID=UPI001B80DF49
FDVAAAILTASFGESVAAGEVHGVHAAACDRRSAGACAVVRMGTPPLSPRGESVSVRTEA